MRVIYTFQIFGFNRYGEAVQSSNYELVFSRDSEVTFKSYNLPFSVDSIHTEIEPKKLKFAWNFKDLYAIKGNAYALPNDLVLPHISCISSNFTFGKTKEVLKVGKHYSKFIYDLNATQGEITPEMSQLVKDLTQNATNEFEKIDAIYQYVKSKMRYVAVTLEIGGLQSFEASFVHKNFFGDCKALTNYTKVLLKEAGIESYGALIYRGDKKQAYLDTTFSDARFNHIVLYVPSQDLWLECTSKSYPAGYLGSDNEDRFALLVKENGGGLIKTKTYDETINIQDIDITIQVNDDGMHEVTYIKTLHGEDHEDFRYYVDNADKEQLEKYFVRNLDQTPIRFSSLDIQYEKDKPVSTVKAKFYISKIGTQTGNRFFLNANPIEKLNFYTDNAKEERKGPFYLQNHSTNKLKITYLLPPGYQMESKPIQTSAKESDFGKFEVSSAMEENKYVFTRDFVTKPGIFEGNRYKEMMDFRKEYNKLESSKAVFIKP
ncbi:MAG: transglutaminase family protein [Saprospiraceae bacterium]|nr:transglutaminase family protein [Saprospiraceae bacterium]